MFHMQPFSRVSPAILQLIGNPTHNGKNTWNSFTPVVDIGAGSSRCTICDDMMCWCFRTCAYNSWNWHDLVSTIPLVHRFVLHFTCWPLENTFLVTDTFLLVVFSRRKMVVSPWGPCWPKIWKLSMRFQRDFSEGCWFCNNEASMNNISLVNISFSKHTCRTLWANSKLSNPDRYSFPTKNSPVFWIQSQLVDFDPVNQQLNISPFCEMKFVSSKPDVTITWSNPLHLDVSAENGVFFGKSHWRCQRFGGKLQVVFFCSNCMVLFTRICLL